MVKGEWRDKMCGKDKKEERIEQLISEGRIEEALALAGISEVDFLSFMGSFASEEENHEMAERAYT